jgi:hypothetical protein
MGRVRVDNRWGSNDLTEVIKINLRIKAACIDYLKSRNINAYTSSELIRETLIDLLDRAAFEGEIKIRTQEEAEVITSPYTTQTQQKRQQKIESRLTIERNGGFSQSLSYTPEAEPEVNESSRREIIKTAAIAYRKLEGRWPNNYDPLTEDIKIEEDTQVGGTNEDIISNMPKPTA